MVWTCWSTTVSRSGRYEEDGYKELPPGRLWIWVGFVLVGRGCAPSFGPCTLRRTWGTRPVNTPTEGHITTGSECFQPFPRGQIRSRQDNGFAFPPTHHKPVILRSCHPDFDLILLQLCGERKAFSSWWTATREDHGRSAMQTGFRASISLPEQFFYRFSLVMHCRSASGCGPRRTTAPRR